jgi:hypothetical protein
MDIQDQKLQNTFCGYCTFPTIILQNNGGTVFGKGIILKNGQECGSTALDLLK